MTLIFTERITNRLSYTLDFIFKARGLSYELTTDAARFSTSDSTKFNYSNRSFEGIPTVTPCTLLFDEGIQPLVLDKVRFLDLEIMSFNHIPDLLASIFFVLSRYEEYWITERDAHDRFPAVCSMQSVYGWLHEPICDRWAKSLLSLIGIPLAPSAEFNIQPTFDIDSTYAYKEKGLFRNMAGTIRDVSKGRIANVRERIQVLNNTRKDPFDTFEYIKGLMAQFPETRCFWLMADYGPYNKNLSFNNTKQRDIIQEIAQYGEIGIHPGYDSYTRSNTLAQEISRLSAVLGKPVTSSRQHFLRLRIPETYSLLVEQQITTDYSMGYAETTGFRMGTARKTAWFNLKSNQITSLMIQPFCYMDGTLNEYLKLSPEQAKEKVRTLKAMVSEYGGTFSFIWHNETLGFQHHWSGWEPVFEESISYS